MESKYRDNVLGHRIHLLRRRGSIQRLLEQTADDLPRVEVLVGERARELALMRVVGYHDVQCCTASTGLEKRNSPAESGR